MLHLCLVEALWKQPFYRLAKQLLMAVAKERFCQPVDEQDVTVAIRYNGSIGGYLDDGSIAAS